MGLSFIHKQEESNLNEEMKEVETVTLRTTIDTPRKKKGCKFYRNILSLSVRFKEITLSFGLVRLE